MASREQVARDRQTLLSLVARGYTIQQILGYTGKTGAWLDYWARKLKLQIADEENYFAAIPGDLAMFRARCVEYAKSINQLSPCVTRKATEAELQEFAHIKPIDRRRESMVEKYILRRKEEWLLSN